jgi:hypothetical protein
VLQLINFYSSPSDARFFSGAAQCDKRCSVLDDVKDSRASSPPLRVALDVICAPNEER